MPESDEILNTLLKTSKSRLCLSECKFWMIGLGQTTITRSNDNCGKGYPYAEIVLLNCALDGICPVG